LSSPGALPAKTGSAPGESGFTVTVFLPVQLSGLTLSHRSSGMVASSLPLLTGLHAVSGTNPARSFQTIGKIPDQIA
ncbi:hypothetical protein OFP00_40745, partial [Escherichia coli]|nr:hypothetical protein [Escherichia coli]